MPETTVYRERIGGIREQWVQDGDKVHVHRSEDAQPVIDAVAKANLEGTREVPGLGRLVAEVPITLAMQFCDERGIPWDKFIYGNAYDDEFKRFIAAHPRIAYTHKRNAFSGVN